MSVRVPKSYLYENLVMAADEKIRLGAELEIYKLLYRESVQHAAQQSTTPMAQLARWVRRWLP